MDKPNVTRRKEIKKMRKKVSIVGVEKKKTREHSLLSQERTQRD